MLIKLVQKGKLSISDAAEEAEMTENEPMKQILKRLDNQPRNV